MRLASTLQAEKQQKLAEIQRQLQATHQSVRQGKQLLGSLMIALEPPSLVFESAAGSAWPQTTGSPGESMRVVTTSPILAETRTQPRH